MYRNDAFGSLQRLCVSVFVQIWPHRCNLTMSEVSHRILLNDLLFMLGTFKATAYEWQEREGESARENSKEINDAKLK